MTMTPQNPTAASRYRQLESRRSSVLLRARECAAVTIPALMPPEGHNESSTLPTPYQGIGARGVNNLSSKLLLALFPPNSPFFRLLIDDFMLVQLTKQQGMRAEVEKALNQIERSVMNRIESDAIRVSGFEALKQLLVAGNVLLYLDPKGGMRTFKLNEFVVRRDPSGTVLEIVVCEKVSRETLAQTVLGEDAPATGNDTSVELYTHITRDAGKWNVRQEVKGRTIPGTSGSYPLDKSPWIALRFTKIDGEDYGRSYVEEYLGDIRSLEALSQAVVEGSAAAAKVLFLVNPNGTTQIKTIAESRSGDIRSGNAADVTVLQLNKFADFRVASETIDKITQRLAFAFLLNTAIQRGGERVTAEEIRFMAGELEDALGGVYSILSQEFQLPVVTRLMFQMERAKQLPTLPKGIVRPAITTGLEALGRGHDMNKLQTFAGIAAQAANLPPEINRSDFLTRIGTSLGIDMAGLVKTAEEIAQEQQQLAMQQMAQKLGPKAMDIVRDQMDPSNGDPAQAPQGG